MGNWSYFTLLIGVITPFITESGAHLVTPFMTIGSGSESRIWESIPTNGCPNGKLGSMVGGLFHHISPTIMNKVYLYLGYKL